MKLRTYILTVSIVTVGLLAVLFAFQLKRILGAGMSNLRITYSRNVQSVISAVLSTKRDHLRSYGRLLGANYNLAGLYVVSRESQDTRLVEEQIELIKIRSGFDIVDMVAPEGGVSILNHIVVDRTELDAAVRNAGGVVVTSVGGELAMLGTASLQLYDEPVGYVLFGQFLNRSVAAQVGSITGAAIRFREGPHVSGSAASSPIGLYMTSGTPVEMEMSLQHPAFVDIDVSLAKSLFAFGLACLAIWGSLSYLVLEFGFVRRFQSLLYRIQSASNSIDKGGVPVMEFKRYPIKEMRQLARAFNRFALSLGAYDRKVKQQARETAEIQKQAEMAQMAQQLAHDIRSPLSALDMFVLAMEDIPDHTRLLVRGAINRINDIANSLLTQSKERGALKDGQVENRPELVFGLIDTLVSEKRLQFRELSQVQILFDPTMSSVCDFVSVKASEFKTVLSNLINNAVEAMDGEGTVTVGIFRSPDSRLHVRVKDTGRGIPDEVKRNLGQRGVSVGKVEGSGLGLYHAVQSAKAWGGELQIDSQLGMGSVVDLILPLCKAPEWCARRVELPDSGKIWVLDDDRSVFEIWREKLIDADREAVLQRFEFFSSVGALFERLNRQNEFGLTLFCDLELRDKSYNGLMVRDQLRGQIDHFVLVTSDYDVADVQAEAIERGIQILPKPLLPYIELEVANEIPAEAMAEAIEPRPV